MIYNLNCESTFREAAFMIGLEVIHLNLIVHYFDLRKVIEYSRNMPHKRATGTTANEICSVKEMNYEPANAIMII